MLPSGRTLRARRFAPVHLAPLGSIYDIQRAVADKATVPIYYESRISKLSLNAAAMPGIDEEFDEITEGEELTKKEKLKTKWAALEALVRDPKRIAVVAEDLARHFERRVEAMEGKAMIVCMSRRICVDLYNALVAVRPEWADGRMNVVMTGSAEDGPAWQPHIHGKEKRKVLANRFKDAKDPFRIVIVRDMWLTGFDAPCLHTMYVDKPMQGHGLMQAIARVNRVFKNKPGGLIVDYLGLADQLKKALATYTESGGRGNPTFDTAAAIAVMLEKYDIACDMMHGFNRDKWVDGKPSERLALIPGGQEHILEQEDGKRRFVQVVTELSKAFALSAASDEAAAIRDDVSFLTHPPPPGGFALRATLRSVRLASPRRLGSKRSKRRWARRRGKGVSPRSRSTRPYASSSRKRSRRTGR